MPCGRSPIPPRSRLSRKSQAASRIAHVTPGLVVQCVESAALRYGMIKPGFVLPHSTPKGPVPRENGVYMRERERERETTQAIGQQHTSPLRARCEARRCSGLSSVFPANERARHSHLNLHNDDSDTPTHQSITHVHFIMLSSLSRVVSVGRVAARAASTASSDKVFLSEVPRSRRAKI